MLFDFFRINHQTNRRATALYTMLIITAMMPCRCFLGAATRHAMPPSMPSRCCRRRAIDVLLPSFVTAIFFHVIARLPSRLRHR